MKKVTRFFIVALLIGICSFGYAQHVWELPKTAMEIQIGDISNSVFAGNYNYDLEADPVWISDTRKVFSKEELYEKLLQIAKGRYASKYPNFALRSFKCSDRYYKTVREGKDYFSGNYYYNVSAIVVIIDSEKAANVNLSSCTNKALSKVPTGSSLALDQITVTNSIDQEELKDNLIDVLLAKGYRVVAKEYLQKLDKEIKDAIASGSFNPETMVEGNNFSAVGYFINVKVTESSIRVQVVDVSKGEYVGNATVNF